MTTDSSAPRICLVCGAALPKGRQRRKEARAALTPEQRAAINARARENYKKRKAQTHIPQEDNHD